ncbi:MAG TPA: ABC transporter permease [Candidatus Dormibacteraeota bacterium]
MSARRTLATARRVLAQLAGDPRTVAMLLVVPVVLMILLKYVFDKNVVVFSHVAPILIAIFPFVLMFLITSVSMLRERTSGTLERLLSMPIAKLDLLFGYAIAFGGVAIIQVAVVLVVALGPLSVSVPGSVVVLSLFGVLDALLGMALGLFLSALAHTEFQAVQLLPAFVFPQLLVCGLFAARDQMAGALQGLADAFPLTYAVDGVTRAAASAVWSGSLVTDLVIVAACIPLALGLGAATLQRRTG